MHTLQEILQRKKEIFDQKQANMEKAKEVKTKGGDNMRSQLKAIATDQEKLDLELRDLIFEEIEVRSRVEKSDPISTPIVDNKNKEEREFEELNRLSKRQTLCLSIGKQVRKKEFTAAEKRALGTALTTTATTFVEATELANGVNNAGVFIQTSLIFDLLREEGKLSPILEDVAFTDIKGLTSFPYRKSRDKAQYKAEEVSTINSNSTLLKVSRVICRQLSLSQTMSLLFQISILAPTFLTRFSRIQMKTGRKKSSTA